MLFPLTYTHERHSLQDSWESMHFFLSFFLSSLLSSTCSRQRTMFLFLSNRKSFVEKNEYGLVLVPWRRREEREKKKKDRTLSSSSLLFDICGIIRADFSLVRVPSTDHRSILRWQRRRTSCINWTIATSVFFPSSFSVHLSTAMLWADEPKILSFLRPPTEVVRYKNKKKTRQQGNCQMAVCSPFEFQIRKKKKKKLFTSERNVWMRMTRRRRKNSSCSIYWPTREENKRNITKRTIC